MGEKRVQRSKELKLKVASEAICGERLSKLAEDHRVRSRQVTQWKRELQVKGPELLVTRVEQDEKRMEAGREELYRSIGHQQVAISWLGKVHPEKPG